MLQDYQNKVIEAVFYAHPDRLRQLIDEGQFDIQLLEDIGLLTKPFPIWRITQCWEEAMGDDASVYRNHKIAADFMTRNKAMKEIFQHIFGVRFDPIDYQAYWENFFASDPKEPDVEIISPDKSKILAKYGTTALDVELYCAVEKFDFQRVEKLLEKGANPSAATDEDESDEGAIDRIGSECSFLSTCQLGYAWNPKANEHVDEEKIGDLIGWAAHEKMYRLLEKYKDVWEPSHVRHTKKKVSDLVKRKMQFDLSMAIHDDYLSSLLAGKVNLEAPFILGADDLSVEIEGPESGWLDISFNQKSRKPFLFNASDVYPPFEDIRSWLEDMLYYYTVSSKNIVIDCERYHVLMSYDYLGEMELDEGMEPVVLVQMFDDINDEDRVEDYEGRLQFVAPLYWFVSLLYNTIKNYVCDNRRSFYGNWGMPNSSSFVFRTFIRSIESKKIEESLDLNYFNWQNSANK